ncbi:NDR1/HIN1-like protein 6 [Oryza sativa Japonica Group]|uniref:Os08g0324200 protein n=3 Tax=Oryza TaxID=4527 RepID=Q6ZBB7_ORYSJ|nr:NDR1/HIN1-like protein 6 [Oryza sativa Japonica Group]EAZ42310.1 hypothetical protein OsJ_26883 [Oryza sativa Japonica Group]KAF2919168.1 hypothetical protein DAI22_08g113100 [Oryza sativa Japonica Group]BAD03245.1 unknown protein [Oryza sativa Japonica Group]BAD03668.1 unknown protein [Oryza sativa Japonica Group]BAF23459.1 Os08g0324200 [Oryza sativa Japonica Group]|eukprot:NP_001061545.1 Os08g0324200 [Oryza sativa Japonica Group]
MAYDGGSGPSKPPPPPRYVMLTEEYGSSSLATVPPGASRNMPRHRITDGGSLRGCLCWCCCFLLLLVVAVAATSAYLLYACRPKAPSYSVSDMSVARFDVSSSDLTVYAKLVASVRAENPNDMVGIGYGAGSRAAVSYRGTTLCSGRLPAFYQGHRNTTVVRVAMEGRHGFGPGLQGALEESEEAGNVPLDVYVSAPVTLRLGDVDLREVTVNVHCALVVDGLSPKKKPAIKSAEYRVNVEF